MDPLRSLITQFQISCKMTGGKYDDPVWGRRLCSLGSVENDHLEIRTRLSAAVTTTQLLLERLKRYQRIISRKCSLRLTGSQKYVIGLRPSVLKSGPKIASMNRNVSYFNSKCFSVGKTLVWKIVSNRDKFPRTFVRVGLS